jgi:hypothetical protein
MTQSNLNIIMVMIGLFLAMSLDMLVQDILIGSIELAVCVGLFIMFNHNSDEKSESK